MDETELAERIRAGDITVAEHLVSFFYRPLFRFLWQATGSYHDAEDIAAQSIQRASRDIRGFRGDGPLRAWVFRVAYRELLKYRRRQSLTKLFAVDPQRSVEPPSEDYVVLIAALQKLSDLHREAFLLVEVEGFTMDEAAQSLRTSPGTVKSRCHYAKRRLRELLAPAYPEVSNYVAPIPK